MVLSHDDFQTVDSDEIELSTMHYDAAEVDPSALDADACVAALRDALHLQRDAQAALISVLAQAASLPEARLREMGEVLVEEGYRVDAHVAVAALLARRKSPLAEAAESLDRVLAVLRPAAIDRAVNPSWSPFRYRRAWKEFCARYDRLARERSAPVGGALASVAESLGLLCTEPCLAPGHGRLAPAVA